MLANSRGALPQGYSLEGRVISRSVPIIEAVAPNEVFRGGFVPGQGNLKSPGLKSQAKKTNTYEAKKTELEKRRFFVATGQKIPSANTKKAPGGSAYMSAPKGVEGFFAKSLFLAPNPLAGKMPELGRSLPTENSGLGRKKGLAAKLLPELFFKELGGKRKEHIRSDGGNDLGIAIPSMMAPRSSNDTKNYLSLTSKILDVK